MNSTVTRKAWGLEDGKTVPLKGYGFGSRYPAIVTSVTGKALRDEELAALSEMLLATFPGLEEHPHASGATEQKHDDFGQSVEWLLDTIHRLQRFVHQPVYERGRILSLSKDSAKVFLPAGIISTKPLFEVLRALLELMENMVQGGKNPHKYLKRLAQAAALLEKTSPKGGNEPYFIQAAFNSGIPFYELPDRVTQYGQGKRGRFLHSSFSEETSVIAAKLSRNKMASAAVLRRAGIPVPEHKLAPNAEKASRIAEHLGYPVVVKPADLDGGVAVSAGLRNSEELVAAFKMAQKYSRNILVEKHFEGKDYRIPVFQNDILSAVERVPGGVTGDGKHTVRQLVEQLNADPLRGEGRHAPLKKLLWNNEAIDLLKHAGMDSSSVPAKGEFVRLRRAANIASGGVPVLVTDKIHPDNKQLAIRAAQVLRLNLAGVDMLIPDISRSWHETGAVICEVNGQPNLGRITEERDVFTPILRELVPGNGRVPVTVILGAPPSGTLANDLEQQLLKKGICTGCHGTEGVRVNGDMVLKGDVAPFNAGQMLTVDRNVEAVILNINDSSVLSTGLPYARIDFLVLTGKHISLPDNADNPSSGNPLTELLELVVPACDGRVITVTGSGFTADDYKHLTSLKREKAVAPGKAKELLVAAMTACLEHDVAEKESR